MTNGPAVEAIRQRRSCRTFSRREIDPGTLRKLEEYLPVAGAQAGPGVRFALVRDREAAGGAPARLGTYGMISGAGTFIAGVCGEAGDALSLGYWFERIVLAATDMGLSTCWLGGTFRRGAFGRSVRLGSGETVAVVSPVGYCAPKPRLADGAIRALAGSDARKPWGELFFCGGFAEPLREEAGNPFHTALSMVRLAPSASNRQPWRIVQDGRAFHFYLCRTKFYPKDRYDMQRNDIGIAMCHFELTLNELGFGGEWRRMAPADARRGWEYVVTWLPAAGLPG